MAELTGGRAVIEALRVAGVTTVFGIPGVHNLAMYDALYRLPGIQHVVCRHEQGAGFAADGYARVKGKPGVCVTTTGPAALNALTALGQAHSDSVPVLLIAPGMPINHPGGGNGLLHEVRDQRAAFEAVIGHAHRVRSVAEIPLAVARAFMAMTCGRAQPAYLEIPLDLIDQVERADDIDPLEPVPQVADMVVIAAAARALAAAAKPGLIVGGGARDAAEDLVSLAERVGAPVVSTANGKGTFPEHHPLSIGAGLHHQSVANFVAECDTVLAVGTELASTDLWNGPLRFTGELIRIDVDPERMITNALPDHRLVGDARATVAALRQRLGASRVDPDALRRVQRWQTAFRKQAAAEGEPWLPMMRAIGETLGPDGVLAGDSAMACYYGALSNLRLDRQAGFLYPTGFGTLGYGLPAAIGAKLACPQRRVMALHGDGGLMFTVQELASAAQLGLALPVVVADNGGYGEIRREMVARGEPIHAVDLPKVDFVRLAKSMGCHGVAVETEDRLTGALRKAFASDRPTVLHVTGELAGR